MHGRRALLRGVAALALAALAGACATDRPAVQGARVWDARAGRFISEADLDTRLARARVVLLGELHDNAAHHAAQAAVLRKIVAGGARPALVMEQFDVENQAAMSDAQRAAQLGAVHRGSRADPDAIAEAGKLDRKGWEWPFYRPLVATALEHELPIVAGNLSRTDARRVIGEGFGALGVERMRELGLPPRMEAEQTAIMRREIVEGHCGMLPAAMVEPMVRAQQARDAVMADAIVRYRDRGAVLIAGSGHVRRDVGVPVYLAARDVASVSVGFMEAPREGADPATLAEAGKRFDFVWVTPGMARGDACADMRRSQTPVAPPARIQ